MIDILKQGVREPDNRPKLRGRFFKKNIQFVHMEGGEASTDDEQ